jgi:hypothetical protein
MTCREDGGEMVEGIIPADGTRFAECESNPAGIYFLGLTSANSWIPARFY